MLNPSLSHPQPKQKQKQKPIESSFNRARQAKGRPDITKSIFPSSLLDFEEKGSEGANTQQTSNVLFELGQDVRERNGSVTCSGPLKLLNQAENVENEQK